MLEQIENHLVLDSYWKKFEQEIEVEKVLNQKGYHNRRTGEFVAEADAFHNALWECMFGKDEEIRKEFKEAVLEIYYSNWIREE